MSRFIILPYTNWTVRDTKRIVQDVRVAEHLDAELIRDALNLWDDQLRQRALVRAELAKAIPLSSDQA